jgi:hypothetical protein
MPPLAEALAFQEAAGIRRQPLFLTERISGSSAMRALILVAAAALALAGCGNNDQKDANQNYDENLTAENIVSNDVTAIDAVTGDAANMAADVDMNFGNLVENGDTALSNDTDGKPAPIKPAPRKPAPKPAAPATEPVTNAATNAG